MNRQEAIERLEFAFYLVESEGRSDELDKEALEYFRGPMSDQELWDQREELLGRLENTYGPWTEINDSYWEREQGYDPYGYAESMYVAQIYTGGWEWGTPGGVESFDTRQEAMAATDAWLLSQGKCLIGGVP